MKHFGTAEMIYICVYGSPVQPLYGTSTQTESALANDLEPKVKHYRLTSFIGAFFSFRFPQHTLELFHLK